MTNPEVGPGYRVGGRYRLTDRIGGGGMGAVWLGTDERLGREVAVKQLVLPVGISPEAADEQRARIMREGRIAARVHHPHAISVYDVADDAGVPWLVMEHLPSRSLAAVLSDDGVLPVQQVAQIGAQLADALVATHAAGIVHRDVKPGNVLVGRGDRHEGSIEGLVKITDFGISHATGDVRLTQTGMVTGTPAYLSPEVARGEEPGPAGDVWSLGATLFTALEGEPPFGSSGNSLELLYRVAAGQPNHPVRSGALTPVLERMLTADPAARPSMTEVRDTLARIAAGSDGDVTAVMTARTPLRTVPPPPRDRTRTDLPAAVPVSPPTRPATTSRPVVAARPAAPARRGSRWPVVVAAVVALVLLAGAGVWLATRGSDDGTTTAAPSATTTSAAAPPAEATAGTTAEQTTEQTTTEQATTDAPTTEAPTSEPDVVTAAEVAQAITAYYALLPDDARDAYARTGPTLQGVIDERGYRNFWRRFEQVVLGPVSATDGSLVATAQVTFVERGDQQVEQHQFTLVEGPDGTLLMDSDVAV